MAGGRLDAGRLDDRQLYRFMAGGRIVDDRRSGALVPALAQRNDHGSGA